MPDLLAANLSHFWPTLQLLLTHWATHKHMHTHTHTCSGTSIEGTLNWDTFRISVIEDTLLCPNSDWNIQRFHCLHAGTYSYSTPSPLSHSLPHFYHLISFPFPSLLSSPLPPQGEPHSALCRLDWTSNCRAKNSLPASVTAQRERYIYMCVFYY